MFSKIRAAWAILIGTVKNKTEDGSKGNQVVEIYATKSAQEGDMSENYLVDFSSDRWGNMQVTEPGGGSSRRRKKTKTAKVKVSVKPKDVLDELERVPTMYTLDGLEEKIVILKDKEALITQYHTRNEVAALIQCLENRKRYTEVDKSGREFRAFFSQFDTTNDQKIQALCEKYNLQKRSADIFVPEFPDAAVKVMKEFTDEVVQLRDKKPLFFVIATPESFNEAYGKRDPILLAQSPFGFYYHILGAWDKEMLYLPEL